MNHRTPWDEIQRPVENYNVRLTDTYGLIPTYWGKDPGGKCLFVARLDGNHLKTLREAQLSIQGIEVDLRARPQDGHQNLVLTLVSHLDRELFHALCETLARSLRSAHDSGQAMEMVVSHLKRWQKFLAGGKAHLLSITEIRGLFAELEVLRTLLELGLRKSDVVEAWQGADGGNQDFVVKGLAMEVKSIAPKATNRVDIASESQLDSAADALFLVVKYVAQGSGAFGVQSLNEIVRQIVRRLVGTAALEEFQIRLGQAGYEELDHYNNPQFQVSATRAFEVREGFPRLVRSNLDAGIHQVRYSLDIEALKPFECPIHQLWDRLKPDGNHA